MPYIERWPEWRDRRGSTVRWMAPLATSDGHSTTTTIDCKGMLRYRVLSQRLAPVAERPISAVTSP